MKLKFQTPGMVRICLKEMMKLWILTLFVIELKLRKNHQLLVSLIEMDQELMRESQKKNGTTHFLNHYVL
jgi:hypothetical protein